MSPTVDAARTSRTPIRSVLVANRGEIAVRIIRTLRALGLRALAVYSHADRESRVLSLADEALEIGAAAAETSYLDPARLLDAARRLGADAVHPGYGFLSENASFARAVEAAGLVFLGPRPETLTSLGDKVAARALARSLGVPIAPGGSAALRDVDDARTQASRIGYPVLLKAAAGGGGRGIRVVRGEEGLESAWRLAASEARAAFGSADLFCERYLEGARHVEVQVLGDGEGGVRVFEERDCSIQRRLQKLVEETPSPGVDAATRERLLGLAFEMARHSSYRSAGTFEFLLARDGEIAFLEVNPRIQVEHPTSESTSGLDLVALQIDVANGRRFPASTLGEARVAQRGHSIELRVNAEDPLDGFLPAIGRIRALGLPAGPGIRVDTALTEGDEVTPHYDSLLAKIIASGETRDEALGRLRVALTETRIDGIPTTLPVGHALLADAAFCAGRYDCSSLESLVAAGGLRARAPSEPAQRAALAASIAALVAREGQDVEGSSSAARVEPAPPISAWRTDRR